ncbi:MULTISPECIES: hypothetical protein [Burkholderia]|uniref:hypothetical protein n=1 Tax=Burkholderia TaxID=32008 RepID=UPI0009BCD990|nr:MULTISPECIES: hypothetical protein [Burkholderia]MBH9665167.1 hypothetical protein [Burkholderia multivorans]MBJ9684980.1 hypothetical protein [Burkholderia multivorans]MBU9152129.1 hypothetical protein [Burkholderia multivorans]MBU9209411.1 hypothetical protein [Burkholderia multivorans]MBU9258553.1 hypothetical protein [Burkholderia multivorans]
MTNKLDIVLDQELRDALDKSAKLDVLRTILVKYRDKGFSQNSVNELLAKMRNRVAEDVEDRILEIMDIVSGFCAPNMRVW